MINQKEFLTQIKLVVQEFDAAAEVILFGSRARGDNREDSDWDVLIITSHTLNQEVKNNLRDKIYDIELHYLQDVSVMIVDRTYYEYWELKPLFKNVSREGVII